MAEGQEVTPLEFRKGDFWDELAVDFNRVAERVQSTPTPAGDADDHVQSPGMEEGALNA